MPDDLTKAISDFALNCSDTKLKATAIKSLHKNIPALLAIADATKQAADFVLAIDCIKSSLGYKFNVSK